MYAFDATDTIVEVCVHVYSWRYSRTDLGQLAVASTAGEPSSRRWWRHRARSPGDRPSTTCRAASASHRHAARSNKTVIMRVSRCRSCLVYYSQTEHKIAKLFFLVDEKYTSYIHVSTYIHVLFVHHTLCPVTKAKPIGHRALFQLCVIFSPGCGQITTTSVIPLPNHQQTSTLVSWRGWRGWRNALKTYTTSGIVSTVCMTLF